MKHIFLIIYFLYINFTNAYQTLNDDDFYNKIYLPTKNIYTLLKLEIVEEISFPQYTQMHNCTLDIQEVDLIYELLQNYIEHINNVNNFNSYYYTHKNNIENTTIYSIFSTITATILAIPSSLINIAQMSCHGYECDKNDYKILDVKNDINHHDIYCAKKGIDYNCLKYNYQILGIYNLLQNHQYTSGCDRDLEDIMIGQNIVLGTYSTNTDVACVVTLAIIPYLPSLLVLLPNLYFIPKSIYSSIKLSSLKNKTVKKNESPPNLAQAIFNDLVEKVKQDQMNEVIKQIILHVLVFHDVAVDNHTSLTCPLLEEYTNLFNQPTYLKKIIRGLFFKS